ncbi:MAG: hypothetical protein CMJ85_01335 [Planctomycetes bacterium]|nr:hypothetical protein [Planctomycetota bacterium]MDP6424337.1 hypothetical protein [Planctomycetota bacterium]
MRSMLVSLLLVSPILAQLSEDNFSAWRDPLRPAAKEIRWQRIPWLSSFAAGLRRANAEDKPVLVWVMNGHPLGCT